MVYRSYGGTCDTLDTGSVTFFGGCWLLMKMMMYEEIHCNFCHCAWYIGHTSGTCDTLDTGSVHGIALYHIVSIVWYCMVLQIIIWSLMVLYCIVWQ